MLSHEILINVAKAWASVYEEPIKTDVTNAFYAGAMWTTKRDNLTKVTRLEVIDAEGRSYTNHKVTSLEFSFQDDNRTLKIFIKK